MIDPTLTCPKSTTVVLSDYEQMIPLNGADARDNIRIQSVEYIPQILDKSAVYEAPDRLILSRKSVGRNYTVFVKTLDVDDNAAECKYHIVVRGKSMRINDMIFNGKSPTSQLVNLNQYIKSYPKYSFISNKANKTPRDTVTYKNLLQNFTNSRIEAPHVWHAVLRPPWGEFCKHPGKDS